MYIVIKIILFIMQWYQNTITNIEYWGTVASQEKISVNDV